MRNGVMYVVDSWDVVNGIAIISTVDNVVREPSNHSLTVEQIKLWLRLSYAQTYASCQGTEFTGSLRLHCTDSPRFTRKHLFVGLSRAKDASLVSVV